MGEGDKSRRSFCKKKKNRQQSSVENLYKILEKRWIFGSGGQI